MSWGGGGRRTVLTSAALVAAVGGALVEAGYRDESVFDIWTPLLVASWAPPALALAASRLPAGRWVALAAAVITGGIAVPLVPYGYGFYQLPTVVLLSVAARRDR